MDWPATYNGVFILESVAAESAVLSCEGVVSGVDVAHLFDATGPKANGDRTVVRNELQ